MNENCEKFDLIIVGCGPAGATCALTLAKSGLKIALIEKSEFPRDKICGDAIPGPAFRVFDSVCEKTAKEFYEFGESQNVSASKVVAPNGKEIVLSWVTKSYNSKRIDFDNFLFEKARETDISIFQNEKINKVETQKDGVLLISKNRKFKAELVIGADGANGVCAKQIIDSQIVRAHHVGAVRAYYQNVEGIKQEQNEFYMLKKYLPGYFWIFPLKNGWVNVGFGMLSQKISDKKINLTKSLEAILTTHPELKKRFGNAEQIGKTTGFGLPLGSRIKPLVGNRIMLCGDAGSLIDPLFGHGIDKAMISGKIAAETAIKCFSAKRFDADFLKKYEKEVYGKFSSGFRRNYFLMKTMGRFPQLVDLLALIGNNEGMKKIFRRFS